MQKKLPRIINQKEFELLFIAAKKIEQKTKSKFHKSNYKQYRLAMLLGFEAGMRISEVIGWVNRVPPLTKERIEGNSIRIISGKGGKDRIVPKPKRMNQLVIDLLPLTVNRRSLQYFIKKLGRTVLNKEISFHTLRHGFVTHLINQGRPLHEIQMLAGHSRLDTTGIYLHADPKKAIEKAQEAF